MFGLSGYTTPIDSSLRGNLRSRNSQTFRNSQTKERLALSLALGNVARRGFRGAPRAIGKHLEQGRETHHPS